MKVYTLSREQFLPVSIDEAWQFFSTPDNLDKITPGDMGFTVITDLQNKPIYEGMNIEYKVSPLLGIKLRWVTEIGVVQPGVKFVDMQHEGPFSLWEHTHIFKQQGSGVLMTDELRYALPFGVIGQFAHMIIVKKKLDDIFSFRAKTLKDHFG